ncbi:hypothetical protein SDC9_196933 [bioreactor metagenome]|uniref:Biotin transporter BioY n=1 Tax=bioreactor metagenome TaxID=1076179 RepID=A0A645IEF5_9ZZZZ
MVVVHAGDIFCLHGGYTARREARCAVAGDIRRAGSYRSAHLHIRRGAGLCVPANFRVFARLYRGGLRDRKDRRGSASVPRIIAGCVAGLAVIYAIGLPYMALIINAYLGKNLSFTAILWAGMIPFLPYDALKIAITAMLCRKLVPLLKRQG